MVQTWGRQKQWFAAGVYQWQQKGRSIWRSSGLHLILGEQLSRSSISGTLSRSANSRELTAELHMIYSSFGHLCNFQPITIVRIRNTTSDVIPGQEVVTESL